MTPQITAAGTVIMKVALENSQAGLHALGQRHSAHQHAAREDERARQRRRKPRSSAASTRARAERSRIGRRASAACRFCGGCSSATSTRHPNHGTADLHHAPHHQGLTRTDGHVFKRSIVFAGRDRRGNRFVRQRHPPGAVTCRARAELASAVRKGVSRARSAARSART